MSRFFKGDKILVARDTLTALYSATVLRSSPDALYVKYDTLLGTGDRKGKRLKEYVPVEHVRPALPLDPQRCFREAEIVDVDQLGVWRVGRVVKILENSSYLVAFEGEEGEEERVEIQQWSVRVHRDWDDDSWVPVLPTNQVKSPESAENPKKLKLRIKFSNRQLDPIFRTGTSVEVKHDKEGRHGSWLRAVIVDSIGDDSFNVEYHSHEADIPTEICREIVSASRIRPCPPVVARLDRYMQFEEVDAFCNGGWWTGYILEVLDDDKYRVCVGSKNDVVIVDHSKVRNRHDWVDGKWAASCLYENPQIRRMETETECYKTRSKTVLKVRECSTRVKRKSIKRMLHEEFSKGTVVEVKSNEEGYHGSWYTAVIIGSVENDKYTIEYQTLKTEDESESLREKADASHIRPLPPYIQRVDRFKLFERVEVWYNDGWWVGVIIRILEDLKYTVYFWTTNEELQCEHFTLRPHQEWINGKFIADFMKSPVQLPPKPRPGKSVGENGFTVGANPYYMGMKVEVRSDEEGYSGTWYPAVVLSFKGKEKLLVEYKTRKADDRMELMKEVVDCFYIRPSPPVTQRSDPFKSSEVVEAWYNMAWWHGCICQVFKGSKYGVRITSTDDVVEFQQSELRRYKDWADGRWSSPPKNGFS